MGSFCYICGVRVSGTWFWRCCTQVGSQQWRWRWWWWGGRWKWGNEYTCATAKVSIVCQMRQMSWSWFQLLMPLSSITLNCWYTVVSISAIYCLERLISKMTCYFTSRTWSCGHSHCCAAVKFIVSQLSCHEAFALCRSSLPSTFYLPLCFFLLCLIPSFVKHIRECDCWVEDGVGMDGFVLYLNFLHLAQV